MSLSFLREKMLTSSSNQYLRPEYLTPLPTTLDAKKSPLALLAQTCSQIGADPPSSKSLLPSLSNSSSSSSSSSSGSTTNSSSHHHNSSSIDCVNGNRNSSTTPNSDRSSKKSHRKPSNSASPNSLKSPSSASPNSSSNSNSLNMNNNLLTSKDITIDEGIEREVKLSQRSKTPGSKGGTPVPPATTGTMSPNPSSSGPPSGTKSPSAQSQGQQSQSLPSSGCPTSEGISNSRASTFESSSSSVNSSAHSPPNSSSISSSKLNLNGPDLSPLGSLKHSASVTSSLVPFPGLYPGLPPPSLANAAGQGIPPYLHSYARLKAAAAAGGAPDPLAGLTSPLSSLGGGGNGVSGGCRDPFCTGCQLGSGHMSGNSSINGGKCPAGCSQCDHHKSPLGALGSGAFNGFPFFPGFPSLPPSLAGLSAVYATPSSHSHNSSVLQASQSLAVTPYVCNWVGGPDNYCGKRFASSDELFQHLRSHTSLSSVSAASECASLMERYSQAATHPLLSSAAAHISRTYPTPPLSPLSSARFHPYSKPGAAAAAAMGLSSLGLVGPSPTNPTTLAATFPPPGFSALTHPLSPYYPYSFYGQRLGTSGSLHP